MHNPEKWPGIVDRMVVRMKGKGNMGELMKEMMAGVQAPTDEEEKALVAYLRKHGQRAIDVKRYPELEQPSGQSFKLACGQCHVLPDPRRHTAAEWPAVVARMEQNMAWMNRVVGHAAESHGAAAAARRDPRVPAEVRAQELTWGIRKKAWPLVSPDAEKLTAAGQPADEPVGGALPARLEHDRVPDLLEHLGPEADRGEAGARLLEGEQSASRSASSTSIGGRRMRQLTGRSKSVMSQIARCDSLWKRG